MTQIMGKGIHKPNAHLCNNAWGKEKCDKTPTSATKPSVHIVFLQGTRLN